MRNLFNGVTSAANRGGALRKGLLGTSALVAVGIMFGANAASAQSALDVPAGENTTLDSDAVVSSLSGAGTVNVVDYRLTVNQDTSTNFAGNILSRGDAFTLYTSYSPDEGPSASLAPPVYSGLQAAVLRLGGEQSDYHLSTNSGSITQTNWGYVYENGLQILPEAYSVDTGAPGYTQSGDASAYVNDGGNYPTNYIFTTLRGGGLTKSGVGTLTLSGVNTYRGETYVDGGTLALSGDGSIADSNYVSVAGGATLDLSGVAGGSVSLKGLVGAGLANLGINTLHITADNIDDELVALVGAGGLTVEAGGIVKIGPTAQAYTGATTVADGGRLNINTYANPELDMIAASSSVAVDGVLNISGGGDQTLHTLTGSGEVQASSGVNLILSGDSTYDGTLYASYYDSDYNRSRITVSGGTFNLNGSAYSEGGFTVTEGATLNLGDNAAGTDGGTLSTNGETGIQIDGGGTLSVTRAGAVGLGYAITGAGDFIQAGTGTTLLSAVNSFTGSVKVNAGTLAVSSGAAIDDNSAVTVATGATLELRSQETIGTLAGAGTIAIGGSTLTVNQTGDTTFSGVITGTHAPTYYGPVSSSAPSWYGYTRDNSAPVISALEAGNLYFGDNKGLVVSTSSTEVTNTAFANLYDGGIVEVAGDFKFDPEGDGYNRAGDTSAFVYDQFAPEYTNYYFATQGGGGLIKSGAGTLTLSGINTYIGATTINEGTLALSGEGSIASSSQVALAGGNFDIFGVTGGSATVRSISGGGDIALGANTLHITNAGNRLTGTINGSGGLSIDGGSMTIGSVQAYTGATTIAAGALLVLTDPAFQDAELEPLGSQLAASSAIVVNGNLNIDQTFGQTFQSLSGTNASAAIYLGNANLVIANAAGTFAGNIYNYSASGLEIAGGSQVLTGGNDYYGATKLTGGNLTLGDGGTTGSLSTFSTVQITNGSLTFNRSDVASFTNTITNDSATTGTIIQAGSGTTKLTNAKEFGGTVQITGGTLALQSQDTLGATTTVEIGAAGTLSLNANNLVGALSGAGTVFLGDAYLTVAQDIDTVFSGVITSVSDAPILFDEYVAGSRGYWVPAGSSGPLFTLQEGASYYHGGNATDYQISTNNTTITHTGYGQQYTGDGYGSQIEIGEAFTADVDQDGNYNAVGDVSGYIYDPNAYYYANPVTNYIFKSVFNGGLNKTGIGTLTLAGVNTYTGSTAIDGGTLALRGDGSIATSTSVNVNDGTFDISGVGDGAAYVTQLHGGGNVTLGASTLHLTGLGSDLTFYGLVSGTGGLAVDGDAQFAISGMQAYTGATTIVAGGTLYLRDQTIYDPETGTSTVLPGSLAASSGIMADGTIDVSSTISTTLQTLSGSGQVSIGGSQLVIQKDSVFDGNIGGSYAYRMTPNGYRAIPGTVTFNGNNLTLNGNVDLPSDGRLTLAGAANLTIGKAADAEDGHFNGGLVTGTGTVTVNRDDTYYLNGNISGAANFVQAGTGTTLLSGNNSFTGSVSIIAGTLAVSNYRAIGDDAAVSIAAGGMLDVRSSETIGALTGAGTITLSNADLNVNQNIDTVFSGVITTDHAPTYYGDIQNYYAAWANRYADSSPAAMTALEAGKYWFGDYLGLLVSTSSSTITNTAFANQFGAGVIEVAGDFKRDTDGLGYNEAGDVSAFVYDEDQPSFTNYYFSTSGYGGLSKRGTGTLTLTGISTYFGSANVYEGTLALSGTGSIANASVYANGGTFDISAVTGGSASILSLGGSSDVVLGANTLHLSGASDYYSGAMSGTGGLSIDAGYLNIAGANTYTGATTVAADAELYLRSSLASSSQLVNNGYTDISSLYSNEGGEGSPLFALFSIGPVAAASQATIQSLAGTNVEARFELGRNTLVLSNAHDSYAGILTDESADNGGEGEDGWEDRLTFAALAPTPSDSDPVYGSVLITGGTQVFTGDNTYRGSTELDGGNLTLGDGGTTGSVAGAILLTNGTLTINRSNEVAIEQALDGAGSIVQAGTGTTALTGTNTYTGLTRVSGGTLTLGTSGSIAASSVVNDATFDISGHEGGVSIVGLSGSGATLLGGNILTLSAANGSYAGVASGQGGVTIAGGTQTLSGTNTYTGATTIASGATLALAGTGTLASASIVNAGTLSLSGTRTLGGIVSGAGAVDVTGGTTTLTGANTYTGATTIASGATLALAGAGNIASASIVDAGTLSLSGTRTLGGIVSGAGTLAVIDGTTTLTAANTYTGATTIASGATLALGGTGSVASASIVDAGTLSLSGTRTYGGIVSGAGALDVTGGTTTLTGANTYTGATTIASGATLALVETGSVASASIVDAGTFSLSGTRTYGGIVSGAGAVVVTGGTTTLTNANTYSGTTTIASGATLALSGTGNLASASVVDAGTLSLSGTRTLGGIVSGAGTLAVIDGTTTLTGANTYTGATTIASGATLALSGTGNIAGASIVDAGTLSLSGTRTYDGIVSGAGALVVTGGTTTLTNANTYSGTTTIGSGATLALSGAGNIASASIVDAGTLSLSGTRSYGGIVSGAGALVVAGGTTTLTNTNTYTGATTIGSGATLALSDTGNIASASIVDAGTLSLSGTRTYGGIVSGAGAVNVAGGTTTLTGANTYTGATAIASGATLALSGTGNIASATIVDAGTFSLSGTRTLGGIVSGAGTLAVIDGTTTLTGANTYTGATTIASGATLALSGTGTLASATIVNAGALSLSGSRSLGGIVSGAGTVVVTGGTTTFNGANTYTGVTTVSGGTLALGAGAGLAATAGVSLTGATSVLDASALTGFTLNNLSGVAGSQAKAGGALTLASTANTTFAGTLSGVTSLTKTGAGSVTLSGANTMVGPVVILTGMLNVAGGAAINDASVVTVGTGAIFGVSGNETIANLAGGGTAVIGAGSVLTFGGDNGATSFSGFSGAGGLNKAGTGVWTLSGANALTGVTTVSGGKLILSSAALSGGVSVASGSTLSGSGSVGALSIASGATLDPGATAGAFGTIFATSLTTAGTIRIDFGGNSLKSMSDKIVVSGAINVTGGTIDAHPVSATSDYTFNQYFALTAGTTFTGTFSNSSDFVVNAYDPKLRQRIRYDLGLGAVLEVRYLQDLTIGLPANGSGNTSGTALALNGAQAGADDSFAAMINGLSDETPGAREQSLHELSGEGAESGGETSSSSMGSFLNVIAGQGGGAGGSSATETAGFVNGARAQTRLGRLASGLSAPAAGMGSAYGDGEGGFRTWAQGYGLTQRLGAANGKARTTSNGAGVAIGAEAYNGEGSSFGVAFGYSSPQSEVAALRSKTNADSYAGAVYAKLHSNNLFASATVALAMTDLHSTRSVVIGPLVYSPRGSTTAYTTAAQAKLGYTLEMGASRITPSLSGSHLRDRVDAYAETSGGAANLSFGKTKSDRFLAQGGLAWSITTLVGGTAVTPELRGGFAATFGDRSFSSLARFAGAPTGTGGFRVDGAELPSNYGTAGIGLAIGGKSSPISLSLNYDGAFGSRLTDHQFSGALRFQF